MFSPEKDMKQLIIDILKKDQMSISAVARELEARGVKTHRLEVTGYLKALADMNVLKEKDIKPAKVFSASASRDKNLFELVGEFSAKYGKSDDETATLAAYALQKLFKRAVFSMEVARCGLKGMVNGRKASSEERAEAKAILTRMGYKVPNSDTPTIVDEDLDEEYRQIVADILIERFNLRQFVRETTQLKL